MNFENLLTLAEAEKQEILRDLPAEIASRVAAVPIFFERMPDDEDLSLGIESDTLGFYDEDQPGMPRIRAPTSP